MTYKMLTFSSDETLQRVGLLTPSILLITVSEPNPEAGREFLTPEYSLVTTRIMSYGYDSSTAFSKSVADIEDHATILLDALNLERLIPSESKRPIMFIAHSLGGINLKKASYETIVPCHGD